MNLLALAPTLAASDPDQARDLLAESFHLATTHGYERPYDFSGAVFVAAQLEAWPTMLRAAGRALHHQSRSGFVGLVYLAAILNLVARGLAQHQPEAAALIQGTVTAMLRRLTPDIAAPISGDASNQPVAAFVVKVRRDTTELLTAALGDTRLRELRAQGAAMDEDHACTYARTHIDDYLANAEERPDQLTLG